MNEQSWRSSRRRALARPTLAALSLAVLGACASMGTEPTARTALEPSTLGMQSAAIEWPRDTWWRDFGNADLDQLVEQALAGNPGLQAAQARLARAQAAIGRADAARWPQVNAGADATRQRFTETGLYPPPLAGSINTTADLQLSAGWELDVFGANRAQLDAAIGAARAAQADEQAARNLLASNVARAYVGLARLRAQREVAEATRTQREQILALVRSRVQAGIDTNVELRQAEGALPEINAQIESIDEQTALTRNALAALLGQGPTAAEGSAAPQLAELRVQSVPEAIPLDLVSRRADITAARWRVEAADKQIDVARARFYPNVSLTAFAGFSSIGLDRLTESGSRVFGIGPAIHLPIFDGGALRANLRASDADRNAAVAGYNAALVDAVHEVADAIASSRAIDRQQGEQDRARDAAESAYDLALQRYRAGLGNYLTVLTAESNVLAQRRASADLKARALDNNLVLIRALGGGYRATTG